MLTKDQIRNIKLNPWYLTGFSDAEAMFSITLSYPNGENNRPGIVFSFQIDQNESSVEVLEAINKYFDESGTIVKPVFGRKNFSLRFRSQKAIAAFIIQHF